MTVPASAAPLLADLARTPDLARAAVARIPETGPSSGAEPATTWTVAQVLLHLEAVDTEVWGPRLAQLATEAHPHWAWTEPEMSGRSAASIDAALAAFAAGRAALLEQAAGLDAAAWRRTGTHDVFGELDAEGLLREALAHDLEHLDDLERRAREAADG